MVDWLFPTFWLSRLICVTRRIMHRRSLLHVSWYHVMETISTSPDPCKMDYRWTPTTKIQYCETVYFLCICPEQKITHTELLVVYTPWLWLNRSLFHFIYILCITCARPNRITQVTLISRPQELYRPDCRKDMTLGSKAFQSQVARRTNGILLGQLMLRTWQQIDTAVRLLSKNTFFRYSYIFLYWYIDTHVNLKHICFIFRHIFLHSIVIW